MPRSPWAQTLIDWCHQYPPHLAKGDLQYFFDELIQEPADIFEFDQADRRSAVFGFLSRIRNGQGQVPLDLLAHVPYTELSTPLLLALNRARERVPADATGIMINLPASYAHLGSKLLDQGCAYSHESAHMVAPTARHKSPVSGIEEILPEDYRKLYGLTRVAFSSSPDTVVPEYEIWVKRRDEVTTRSFGVYGDEQKLLGFCNVIVNDTFVDLRTLGVAQEARRQGIGERLLRHALYFANAQGKPNCELTVSVKNRNALQLYERIGFKTFSSTHSWLLHLV